MIVKIRGIRALDKFRKLEVDTWTSWDNFVNKTTPFIVYARVTLGSVPITTASVTATINSILPVQLNDKGGLGKYLSLQS